MHVQKLKMHLMSVLCKLLTPKKNPAKNIKMLTLHALHLTVGSHFYIFSTKIFESIMHQLLY